MRLRLEGTRLRAHGHRWQDLFARRRKRTKGHASVFICNHCPYVKASIGRIVAEAKALREIGIGTVAVMPNDTEAYAADSFEKMKLFSAQHGFTFPYVIDTTREVARA